MHTTFDIKPIPSAMSTITFPVVSKWLAIPLRNGIPQNQLNAMPAIAIPAFIFNPMF